MLAKLLICAWVQLDGQSVSNGRSPAELTIALGLGELTPPMNCVVEERRRRDEARQEARREVDAGRPAAALLRHFVGEAAAKLTPQTAGGGIDADRAGLARVPRAGRARIGDDRAGDRLTFG